MYPFSYTGLKIVHDQKIHEALERQRFAPERQTHKRDLRSKFSTFLARLEHRSAKNNPQCHPNYALHARSNIHCEH